MTRVALHSYLGSAELSTTHDNSVTKAAFPRFDHLSIDLGILPRDRRTVMNTSDIPGLSDGKRSPAARSVPVFQQPWWIEAASRMSRRTTVTAVLANRVVGSLTYVTHRNKIGARLGLSPFWSHLGGPILMPGLDRAEQRDAIRQIAQQLPKNISFRFACDPNCDYADVIADEFCAAGFSRDHDPTYLHNPDDGDVLDGMKARHRAHIRAARRVLAVIEGDAEGFVRFYEANLPTRSHSPCEIALTLLEEGMRRGQASIFLAVRSATGSFGAEIDAAVACIWDDHRYYYWMSTRRRATDSDARKPNADATKVLILAAMQQARQLGLVFDADAPESAGGRALFHTVFGLDRVENRIILTRPTRLTRLYDRVVPIAKAGLKALFPRARIYDPRASLRRDNV